MTETAKGILYGVGVGPGDPELITLKALKALERLSLIHIFKQRRYYDENGRAEKDIDYKHSNGDGSHTFPHEHYWDWSNPDKPHRN